MIGLVRSSPGRCTFSRSFTGSPSRHRGRVRRSRFATGGQCARRPERRRRSRPPPRRPSAPPARAGWEDRRQSSAGRGAASGWGRMHTLRREEIAWPGRCPASRRPCHGCRPSRRRWRRAPHPGGRTGRPEDVCRIAEAQSELNLHAALSQSTTQQVHRRYPHSPAEQQRPVPGRGEVETVSQRPGTVDLGADRQFTEYRRAGTDDPEDEGDEPAVVGHVGDGQRATQHHRGDASAAQHVEELASGNWGGGVVASHHDGPHPSRDLLARLQPHELAHLRSPPWRRPAIP